MFPIAFPPALPRFGAALLIAGLMASAAHGEPPRDRVAVPELIWERQWIAVGGRPQRFPGSPSAAQPSPPASDGVCSVTTVVSIGMRYRCLVPPPVNGSR